MAIFIEGLLQRHALRNFLPDQALLARQLFGRFEDLHDFGFRDDDAAIVVAEYEVPWVNDHAFARRALQINRLLAACDTPPADRLHGRTIAGINREVVLSDPADVTYASVDESADAT